MQGLPHREECHAYKDLAGTTALSVSPLPPSTPLPDFRQYVMDSSHFLPLPFPNHHLASQQNSENMATEKHKIATAMEVGTLLKMRCYSHIWQTTSNNKIQDDRYLRADTNCYSPGSREISCPQIQNDGSDRLLLFPCGGFRQKNKRRYSRTSRTSSQTRADDLSV